MKNNRFYTGTIMVTTRYINNPEYKTLSEVRVPEKKVEAHEVYKNSAVLLRTKYGFYTDIESCDPVDIPYLYLESQTFSDNLLLRAANSGEFLGELFVDKSTIRPYIPTRSSSKNTTSLYALRRKLRKNNK